MATYADLVRDLRAIVPAVPDSGPGGVADKALARMIYRAAVRLVTDVADLNADDPRLPRTTSALTVPADLTDGITLPTSMVKVIFVVAEYSGDIQALVTIVPASQRFDIIHPTPAGYIAGGKLYPISADGSDIVSDSVLESADWTDIQTLTCEYVALPTEPTAMSTTFDLNLAFEMAALHGAGIELARGHAPAMVSGLVAAYEQDVNELRSTLGYGTRSTLDRVQGW